MPRCVEASCRRRGCSARVPAVPQRCFRACAGALIFSFPLLMTMEMWELGLYIEPVRLLVFLLVSLPMLVGLCHYSGFEDTFYWREDVMDALTAFAIGVLTSVAMLSLMAIVGQGMPWREPWKGCRSGRSSFHRSHAGPYAVWEAQRGRRTQKTASRLPPDTLSHECGSALPSL